MRVVGTGKGEGDGLMTTWGRRRVVVTVGDRDPEMFVGRGERAILRALIERRLKEGDERSGMFRASTCM